ncbi:TetR/AcrR family transcriptional regulator [Kineosporia babensis]|uniref:TetR/AcrR family transcriptional regulator n=1 Tax=Kineosporia babensis TaxID=499548 RepID=A0A9X1NH58_9ACTN|nr:TetR/AcrR family transcriptional regulator [Kineosporia babensis]MCD5314063.1 TetR/AcrR family transcriptional regulator [Kineosporia babensis]
MARPSAGHIERTILDTAAGYFARLGYSGTSVQTVATAVGLSKAGLLHHFPSKEALGEAVRERSHALMREAVEQVADLPLGPDRDRLALEILVDQAGRSPGLVAYLISAMATGSEQVRPAPVLEAFGVSGEPASDRFVRVIGALGALAMLTLLAHEDGWSTTWRNRIVAVAVDTLGHG